MSLKGIFEYLITNKHFQNLFWEMINDWFSHKKALEEANAQVTEKLNQEEKVAKAEAQIASTAANKPTTDQVIKELEDGTF